MLPLPIDFQKWVAENKDMLRPPVGNSVLFSGKDVTVMVVGGPNRRTDYHVNETEEWFYQVKGDLCIKVVDDGEFKDIIVKEGSMFLLPSNTPHCPVRSEDTIGIVIEYVRQPHHVDTLRWYCSKPTCRELVYQEGFHCTNLETQLQAIIERFENSEELHTCPRCHTILSSRRQQSGKAASVDWIH